ncbi:MAG: alpha/beta hydrolase [Leptospiraceae bacterium]|nr:alpha/beta hydrolase [Leptospiraceae bacterium]
MKKRNSFILVKIFFIILFSNCSFSSYNPGMASEENNLASPLNPFSKDINNNSFQVTPEIFIHFEKVGKGENLLYVHGGPGIPMQAIGGLSKLKGKSLILYHARGTGDSTKPIDKFEEDSWPMNIPLLEKKLGLSAQIADIERIKRILGDEKINIVGHSYGGLIASLYASEFPGSVNKLILVNPAPIVFSGNQKENDLFSKIGEYQETEEQKQEYRDYMKRFMETFDSLWIQNETSLNKLLGEMGIYYSRAAKNKDFKIPDKIPSEWIGGWNSFALFLSSGRSYDYSKFIKNHIKAETLLLVSDNDITELNVYDNYRTSIPNVKEVVLKGTGHFPFLDNPKEFSKEVLDFLQ